MRLRSLAPSHEGASIYLVLILVITLGASALRFPRLKVRPMHTDEAVHADKFRKLLEQGDYRYNPHEYHGPTLNYFTLIPARLRSATKYTDITELTLRIVPVAFGVVLVLTTVLMLAGLGGVGAVFAALFTAISPAFVFYSRYYIQESLLVCFTFVAIACGYRYVCSKRLAWVLLAGLSVGLMHATKETCIIALGAMGFSLVALFLVRLCQGETTRAILSGFRTRDVVLGILTAMAVSALFHSSFLSNPHGVLDSYLTYAAYLGRAGGRASVHVHPWYYYLQMLVFWKYADGPVWTEAVLVVLAVIGAAAALWPGKTKAFDARLLRVMVLYTAVMVVVYSAIPYKTPWCALGFLHGMIVLAGAGAAILVTWLVRRRVRMMLVVALALASAHLLYQAYRASFVYYADCRNPYVYGHPTKEIFTAVEVVREYAGVYDDPGDLTVQVACSGDDYWPLPWYFRFYRAGYSSSLPDTVGPLIFISEDLEGALTRRLYTETPPQQRQMYLYVFDKPYYIWARPGVKLFGFVRKDLWDRYHQQPDPAELLKSDHDEGQQDAGDTVRPE